ncbi:MAG: bifunctional 5,10-methylenetetrahydrofolate dehydrogenase/5,10-methenyltetrahydrofolate cyclohydrolase [Bacteroidales bacterium]|nr:bifunctional 5,10-methylenetetrahydrofolate dehydrogenase/5,10-methenyltetrahydrofolate cyclohydrolase [Bacteroidales bacterium]
MILIDGKNTAAEIKKQIAAEVEEIVAAGGRRPRLAAILVGRDGASMTYVANKENACAAVGFNSTVIRMSETVSQQELLDEIDKLNRDSSVDGIIVQLPLPKHIDEMAITQAISYKKDVDGFNPLNLGRLALGLETFTCATPKGVMSLLDAYNIETTGKHCVVLGRSNVVGRPLSILLSQRGAHADCTVTLCHTKTENTAEYTRNADIIVVATGVPEYLKGDMVKEGAVIIDVGITRVPDATQPKGYRIVGDVDFESVSKKASYITPVPGGVGPMTIVSLLQNTLQAYRRK